MTINKYSLFGLIGLAVLGIGTALWMRLDPDMNSANNRFPGSESAQESLIAYMPTSVDQLLLVDITPDTKTFLLESNQGFDIQSFSAVLDTIESLAITQAPKGIDDVYSVILLEGNEQFSIDQVQALGLLYFEAGYESQEIASNIRIYGDSESVEFFTTSRELLIDAPEMRTILNNKTTKNAPILFYSRPGDQLGADTLTRGFAEKLQYSVLYGNPSNTTNKGDLILQFADMNFSRSSRDFSPQNTDLITDTTILYLEGERLLTTFGVSETQFSFGAPLLLEQSVPGSDRLLSSADSLALYNALNGQIALGVEVTDQTLGFGLRLELPTPDAYPGLIALQPLWRGLLGSVAGEESLTEETTENSWTLFMSLPSLFGDTGGEADLFSQVPLIRISKNETSTSVQLLTDALPGAAIDQELLFSKNSLLTFMYNPVPIVEMASVNPILGSMVGQLDLLGEGELLGDIKVDPANQQLIITFEAR